MRARQLGFLTPRSIFVVVVLLAMLAIPLWWLRGKSEQQTAQITKEKLIAGGPSITQPVSILPAAVNNPDAFGMTWGTMPNDKLPASSAWMSCHGQPRDSISQPHADSCNPYKGDASCRLALPILCIQKDGASPEVVATAPVNASSTAPLNASVTATSVTTASPTPTSNFTPAGVTTDAWAAGSIASTEPVAGFVIGSLALANARCEKELGSGWRMAEFHDGQNGEGGWGFTAKRSARLDTRLRHWVYINDQPGNCWNNK